jgi:hypothetical protein
MLGLLDFLCNKLEALTTTGGVEILVGEVCHMTITLAFAHYLGRHVLIPLSDTSGYIFTHGEGNS